jgi:ethanolamine ammonia-lyase small subunit
MADARALVDRMRLMTRARVRLGRSGAGLPTAALLAFDLDHSRARDAVQAELSDDALADLTGPSIRVRSRAADRATYLRRPDLGRMLNPDDEALLRPAGDTLAIVVADGLSARAVEVHAAPLVTALFDRLSTWRIAPLVIARQARVAIGDAIGGLLGVDLCVVLIGERPGLSAPDSLGAYLTWSPRPGRLDSERNCVSNIRPPQGLSYADAADTIVRLLQAARACKKTGITLKDQEDPRLSGPSANLSRNIRGIENG